MSGWRDQWIKSLKAKWKYGDNSDWLAFISMWFRVCLFQKHKKTYLCRLLEAFKYIEWANIYLFTTYLFIHFAACREVGILNKNKFTYSTSPLSSSCEHKPLTQVAPINKESEQLLAPLASSRYPKCIVQHALCSQKLLQPGEEKLPISSLKTIYQHAGSTLSLDWHFQSVSITLAAKLSPSSLFPFLKYRWELQLFL